MTEVDQNGWFVGTIITPRLFYDFVKPTIELYKYSGHNWYLEEKEK